MDDQPCTSSQAMHEFRDLEDDIERMKQITEDFDEDQEKQIPYDEEYGINQQSYGSPVNGEPSHIQNCLAMNRAYQEMISNMILRVDLLLVENRERQQLLKEEIEEGVEEKSQKAKRKPMTVYAAPYFRDVNGMLPPLNDEARAKKAAGLLNPLLKPPKIWHVADRSKLREAVYSDRLSKALEILDNRIARVAEILPMMIDEDERQDAEDYMLNLEAAKDQIRNKPVEEMCGLVTDRDIDWLKIAAKDFNGQRTAQNCEQFWRNAGHPSIRAGRWTAEEDKKLKRVAEEHGHRDWESIARDLGTGRSAFMCLQRYQTRLNPCLVTGRWLPDEDKLLEELVDTFAVGDNVPWRQVASYMEARSSEQCAARWDILHPSKVKKRGKWTIDEDMMLVDAVKQSKPNWTLVAKNVPHRTPHQCRERWVNSLNQQLRFGSWRIDEDKKLWSLVEKYGEGRWAVIASHMPGRTGNMVMQRYWRTCRWRSKYSVLKLLCNPIIRKVSSQQTYDRLLAVADASDKMADAKVLLEEEQARLARRAILHTVDLGRGEPSAVVKEARAQRAELSKILAELRGQLALAQAENRDDLDIDEEDEAESFEQSMREARRMTESVDALSQVAIGDVEKQMSGDKWRSRSGKAGSALQVMRASQALANGGYRFSLKRAELHRRIRQVLKTEGGMPELAELASQVREMRLKSAEMGSQYRRGGRAKMTKAEKQLDFDIMAQLRTRTLKRSRAGRPRKFIGEKVKSQKSSSTLVGKRKIGAECELDVSNPTVKKVGKMLLLALKVNTNACLAKGQAQLEASSRASNGRASAEQTSTVRPAVTSRRGAAAGQADDPAMIAKYRRRGQRNRGQDDEHLQHNVAHDVNILRGLLFSEDTSTLTTAAEKQPTNNISSSSSSVTRGVNNNIQSQLTATPSNGSGSGSSNGVSASHPPSITLPPLPPSCATLNAFKTLLLDAMQLEAKAARFGVLAFRPSNDSDGDREAGGEAAANEIVGAVQQALINMASRRSVQTARRNNESAASESDEPVPHMSKELIQNLLSKVSSAVRSGTMAPSAGFDVSAFTSFASSGEGGGGDNDAQSKAADNKRLANVRSTYDYKLLKARMTSMFVWPALVSSIMEQQQTSASDNAAEDAASGITARAQSSDDTVSASAATNARDIGKDPPETIRRGRRLKKRKQRAQAEPKNVRVPRTKYRKRVINWQMARRSCRVQERLEKIVQEVAVADSTQAETEADQARDVGNGADDSDIEMMAYIEPRLKRKNSRLRAPTVAEKLENLRLSKQLGQFPSYTEEMAAANALLAPPGISSEYAETWMMATISEHGAVPIPSNPVPVYFADGTRLPDEFKQRDNVASYCGHLHNLQTSDDLLARYNEACLTALRACEGTRVTDEGVTVTLQDDELVSLLLAQRAASYPASKLAEDTEEIDAADACNLPQQTADVTVDSAGLLAEDREIGADVLDTYYSSVKTESAKGSYMASTDTDGKVLLAINGQSMSQQSVPAVADSKAQMVQRSLIDLRPRLQAALLASVTSGWTLPANVMSATAPSNATPPASSAWNSALAWAVPGQLEVVPDGNRVMSTTCGAPLFAVPVGGVQGVALPAAGVGAVHLPTVVQAVMLDPSLQQQVMLSGVPVEGVTQLIPAADTTPKRQPRRRTVRMLCDLDN